MNKLLLKLIVSLIVVAGTLVSTSAFSYQFIQGSQCPNGASWSAANQPLPYYIHENGSADVPFSQLTTLIQDSWDEWSAPCCSSFSASYQGTTSRTALENTGDVILSWEENSWPTQLGNVDRTIAVTLSSISYNCTIASAPIAFNGVGFQFCTSGSGCTDLQSIATHEIGHNLGLDHSQHRDATMYYAYQGGSGSRSLAQDDVNGVCALYPRSCSCSQDSDCGPNQICNGGQCEEAPCQSNSDCPSGQECNTSTGDCQIPSCGSDADCADGYVCGSQGKCESACPVCTPCSSQNDCGSNGFCADIGGQGRCIISCGQGGSCPGDSRCFEADGYYLCLNPDAAESGEICPADYTCGGDSEPCPGLGNSCGDGDYSQCTTANDACLTTGEGESICTCMCNTDADCGSGGLCVAVSGGQKACVPGSSNGDACDGVSCPSGTVCDNGQCVDDGSSNNNGDEDAGGNNNNSGSDAGFEDDGSSSGDNSNDDDEPTVRVSEGSTRQGSESACSVSAPGSAAPSSLMLLAAFGLGVVWRRKRRRG